MARIGRVWPIAAKVAKFPVIATFTATALCASFTATLQPSTPTISGYVATANTAYAQATLQSSSATTAGGVVLPAVKPAQWIVLVDLALDVGHKRYAMDSIAGESHFWEKRITKIGTVSRSIPLMCGLPSISNVSITLDNSRGDMSALRALGSWRNRTATILFGDASLNSLAAFQPAFTGVISNPVFTGGVVTLTLIDKSLVRYGKKVTNYLPQLNPVTGYPDAVPTSGKPKLFPLGLGYLTSDQTALVPTEVGPYQMPAYLINAATHTYMIGLGAISNFLLYHYGYPIIGSPFSVSYPFIDGFQYTAVTFLAEQRSTDRSPDELEITWAGIATPESRALELFEFYLTHYGGFAASDLDTASFDVVRARFTELGFTETGWAVVDERLAVGAVVTNWCKTWGCRPFPKRNGKTAINFIGQNSSPVAHFSEADIVPGTFKDTDNPDENLASSIKILFDWNYVREFAHSQPELTSADQEAAIGESIQKPLDMRYMRTRGSVFPQIDTTSAITMGLYFLGLMIEDVRLVEFTIPAKHFDSFDLGDIITVTHREGVGEFGYVDTAVTVLQTQLAPGPKEWTLKVFGYVDPPANTGVVDIAATVHVGAGALGVATDISVQLAAIVRVGASALGVGAAA